MASEQIEPRKTPCATCPYRCNVPSGVWHSEEYDKLPAYDAETFAQPAETFMCHQGDGAICAGWFRYKDPYDLLAVRLLLASGKLDPAFVEAWDQHQAEGLFHSGAEAAEHGKRDELNPGERAQHAIDKIVRKRGLSSS